MQSMEFVTQQVGIPVSEQSPEDAEEVRLWNRCIRSGEYEGLYRDENGTLMFDQRYSVTSRAMAAYGLRTCNLNIQGPVAIPVPDRICEAFGLQPLAPEPSKAEKN